MVTEGQKLTLNQLWPRNLDENMYNFVVNTVSADGLALIDARPTAGTVIT